MRSVLFVLSTLLVAGWTVPEEDRVCTVELKEGEQMHLTLASIAFRCILKDDSILDKLNEVSQTNLNPFFSDFCEKRSNYQTCLDDVALQAQVCLNATQQQVFLILRHLLGTALESGCRDNGAALSATITAFKSLKGETVRDDPLSQCLLKSMDRNKLTSNHLDLDVPVKMFVLHKEMVTMRGCIRDFSKGEGLFTGSVDRFLNEIIDNIKCIHPDDKTTVLCGAIHGQGYCPIRRQEDDPRPMDKIIVEDFVIKCIKRIYPDEGGFDDIKDQNGYRDFFKNFCAYYYDVEMCVNGASVFSGLCLNRTKDEIFRLVGEFVVSSLDSGCLAQGEPLAILAYNLARDDNGTEGHPNPMRECLLSTKESLDATKSEDTNAKTRAFHRELGTFKHCFDGKLRGDNMAIFYLDLMFNDILRNMMCVDPESNYRVLCETLHPTLAPQICPFVPQGENEDDFYSNLVDMALTCPNVGEEELKNLDNFTELHQYENFFTNFCKDQTVVADCLKYVVASSKVCYPADEHQMFQIFTHLLDDFVKTGCKDGGGVLAATVYAVKKYKEALEPCKAIVGERFNKLSKESGNHTIFSMETYRISNLFTECFSTSLPDDGEFKTHSLSFLRDILQRLQCINNEGTRVQCETFANAVE